jgi:hypothetical protein
MPETVSKFITIGMSEPLSWSGFDAVYFPQSAEYNSSWRDSNLVSRIHS